MKDRDELSNAIDAASERFMAVCKERDQLRESLAAANRTIEALGVDMARKRCEGEKP